jgi:hypothetical protein
MSFLVSLPESQYATDAFVEVHSSQFSIRNARAAAWASQLSYEDEYDKVKRVTKRWGVSDVILVEGEDINVLPLTATRVLLIEVSGVLFIAFAGTDPLVTADWITNFDFTSNAENIHRGFARALKVVWPAIAAALSANLEAPIIVAGHSLGGAVATLCARRIVEQLNREIAGVYTFGMPRIGGEVFSCALNKSIGTKIYRFVYGTDIVPSVPPKELGFRHVGRRIWCPRNAKFKDAALPSSFEDEPAFQGLPKAMIEEWLGRLRKPMSFRPMFLNQSLGSASQALPPIIADHLPDRYLRALEVHL